MRRVLVISILEWFGEGSSDYFVWRVLVGFFFTWSVCLLRVLHKSFFIVTIIIIIIKKYEENSAIV